MSRLASLLFASSVALTGCANRAKQSISLYEQGDYAGAAKAADDGLAQHPGDDALRGMRIRAALALGDAKAVAEQYAAFLAQEDQPASGVADAELVHDLAAATLGQAIRSPSAQMKLVAIRAIASVEIEALADLVGERLGDDDDRVAATAAVATLRGFGQAAGVATDMLTSEDPEARRIAVDGIAKKVGTAALEDVRSAALDSDASVRMVAIRWLGTWTDAASSDVMLRNLTHPDAGVRAASVTALAQVGQAQSAAPADLRKLATKALGDPALAVRLAGVGVLVGAKATPELTALVDDAHPLVAIEAAIGAQVSAQSALDRAAAHAEWTVRAGALNLVARAADQPAAIAYATKLASDSELRVRLAAGRTLAAAGERDAAIAIFAAAIATPSDDGADIGAAGDLARLRDARGTTALEATLRETASAPERRIAAASAHLGARLVTPALVAALADPNGLVRVHAAAALAELVDN